MAQLVIADDNEFVRDGITAMLSIEEDFRIVGEAADGREALELCRCVQPELVLMDVRMPEMDGLSATRAITRQWPNISVLVLTAYENQDYLLEAIRSGAAGYVLKDASQQELATTIRKVLSGETVLSPELATQLLQRLAKETQEIAEPLPEGEHVQLLQPLTPREIEVLEGLALGQTNRQIARDFGVSFSTVKRHVENIVGKLEVSDRTQAVVKALKLGIISYPEQ